tara:strand:- start:31 stop:240 length:210 start_codon:yes stop_codon:yes gene_type:complete
MIRADERTLKAFAHIAQNVPIAVEWLESWRDLELDRLPQVIDNVAVAQGRCQVLGEIISLIKNAPDSVA